MNKKLFLGMFAAAGMLLATSCSNDELDVVQSGNEAQVTFSLATEGGIATRAISDGTGAKKLVYAVYNANGELIKTIANADVNGQIVDNSAFDNGLTENVTITLAKGQQYTVAFWAQNPTCTAYTTTDLKNVTIDYEGLNNDETRDAFFKAETFTVTGSTKIDVTLRRPFAQINVGVTEEDWNAAKNSEIEIMSSSVVIENAATAINLLTGAVSEPQKVSYKLSTIPAKFASPETLEVETDATKEGKEEYVWLSMSYILVNDGSDTNPSINGAQKATLEDLQFVFAPETNKGNNIVFDEGLNSVPVQRNWRTNILGQILTGNITFNITIDPLPYDGDYNIINGVLGEQIADGVSYDAGTKTYTLSSAAGLAWLSNQANAASESDLHSTVAISKDKNGKWTYVFTGQKVMLTANVDMSNIEWTPVGQAHSFNGTFDGGNNIISNLTANVTDDNYSAGLFGNVVGNIKNVKLSNVNISGHYKAGAVVGSIYGNIENCHVDGGKILSTPNSQKNNANNVGGIVGYVSENSKTGYSVTNCTVNNLDITAYRSVGGIAGRLMTGAKVENCVVNNTNVIADMLAEYAETGKESAAGAVVGDNRPKADLSSNTTNNVNVNVYTVENGIATAGTANGVNYALSQGYTAVFAEDVSAPLANKAIYGTPVAVVMKEGGVLDGNGFSLDIENPQYNGYAVETYGGTIKNLTIDTPVGRGIVISSPKQDMYIDNVVVDGPGYAINTTEHNGKNLIVTNSTVKGWTSFAGLDAVSFTKCNFGENSSKYWQNNGYDQDYDRLIRPYVSTTFNQCVFEKGYYLDLSALAVDAKITLKDCVCGEVEITAENYNTYISIELPANKTLTDCVAFE